MNLGYDILQNTTNPKAARFWDDKKPRHIVFDFLENRPTLAVTVYYNNLLIQILKCQKIR
jgi:hypothetical protein